MKAFKKLSAALLTLCLCVSCFSFVAHAADGRISFTDPSTAVGDEVEVKCVVRSTSSSLGNMEVKLSYDTASLKFESGDGVKENGGALTYTGTGGSTETSFTMKFQALKEGSTKVEVSGATIASDVGTTLTLDQGNSTVKIAAGDPSKIKSDSKSSKAGNAADKTVKGLYSGGSLAAEAGMLIAEALNLGGLIKEEGYILKTGGYEVVDLGDDVYTQGKPHPMIDPEVRIKKILECAKDPQTGVILLDCMLGYGCHPDMAGALAPAIREAQKIAKADGRELYFVASVCGTRQDPQDYDRAVAELKECGVLVEESNARAIRLALKLKGIDYK